MRTLSVRRWPRRILLSANILVALAIAGTAGAFGYVHWRFSQIKTVGVGSLAKGVQGGAPFTLLVVGSDTRALVDGKAFGGVQDAGGQRSDTILLVRVVPRTKQLSILSIPRDLWEHVNGYGYTRINTAFNNGPDLLVSTIETDLGIPINHYVEVNFDTFRQITDAVGGVNFYFPTPARDYGQGVTSGLNIPKAGCVTLTGDQALAFARSRHYQYYLDGYWHSEAASDLARIHRQQTFIKKMIVKAQGQFTNPLALNDIIAGVTKNLTVDSGFSTGLMLDLARTFRTVDTSTIATATLPTSPETINGAQVLALVQPDAQNQIAAFNTLGTTSAAPAASPTATTTAPATLPAPSSSVPPASVAIEVANGSGVNGQAATASNELQALGYHTTVNPVAATSAPTSVIHYAPDSAAAAAQLSRQVGGGVTLLLDPSLASSPYNLELVTGSSFTGVSASAGASQGAPVTTPATVAPTTSTTYLLPGATGPIPPC